MDKEKMASFRKGFGIVLSAAILLAGLCLMLACAGIYFSGGEEPYSREAVAAAFSTIAIPVSLCLILIAAGFLLQWFFPLPEGKKLPVKQRPKQSAAEEKNPAAMQKPKFILLAAGIGLLVFGFCTGGTADVLTKAANICTECIGLG